MVTAILGSLIFMSQWRMPIANEWYAVCVIGIFGLVGQIFMTQAFSLEEASVLAPFKYMELVYALIMGLIFFGEGYSFLALIGIFLIAGGMILNVLAKNKVAKVKSKDATSSVI